MTKWHKYRDIKPSIKIIISNKERSSKKISSRKSNTYKKRFFIKLCDDNKNKITSQMILDEYKIHSNDKVSFWIPLYKLYKTDDYCDDISDIKNALLDAYTVWLYIATDECIGANIKSKAKVIDINTKVEDISSEDLNIGYTENLANEITLWLKIQNIRNCGGLTTDHLHIANSKKPLKDMMLKGMCFSAIVEKT